MSDLASAPGSSAPHLAEGPGNTVVLSWMEPVASGTALRYATLQGGVWSVPRTVATGDDWFVNWADFPSVVPIADSLWAAHWLVKRPGGAYAYDVAVALSRDGGHSWGEAITPHRDNTLTEHGFVTLFPWQGGVGAIWLDGRHMEPADGSHGPSGDHEGGAGGMTLRSAVIAPDGALRAEAEIDQLVCDCCQTDVAVTREGPVAVYRNRTKGEIRDIHVARTAGDHWFADRPVADDGWKIAGCPVNGPAVAARGDDVVVAWFTMAGETPRVRFARSADGGRSFGPPVDLAVDTPLGRVDVVLLGDGSARVLWLDDAADGKGELAIRRVAPDGSLGDRRVVARTEITRPAGFPQLAVSGDDLVVAWTESSGDATRVRTAILPQAALFNAPQS